MKKKYNVTKIYLYSMVIPAFISVSLFGSLWILNEYQRFKKEAVTLRENYFETQKSLIRAETDKVIDYIEYKKSQAEERLKQVISSRTNEAYDIALNLYNEHKTSKSSAEIEKIIKDALRPIRYNNQRGYYFITRLDGFEIMFADRPEMEDLNLLDLQDTKGKFVIRDMIDIIRQSGEGFYRYWWTKPNSIGKNFPKIAYIKHFEPLGWLIGTGEYLDDVVSDIQQEVLARIQNITFGDDGYIFAGQWDGLSLTGPAKGRNMIDVNDVNGVKIVRDLIKAARAGGGFVNYVMPKFNSDITYNKLSYTTGIPEWDWYVGAGVNVDKIETLIQHKRAALQKTIRGSLIKIIIILSAIVLFILLTAKLVTGRISRSFNQISAFFSKAATESARIDSENLHFKEFETLARAANRMIMERNKAEAALRDSERKYRELVQSVNSIILRMDTEGNIIFINKYAQIFFGYNEKEILGKNVIGTIVPQVDRNGFNLEAMIKDIGTQPERYTSNENENLRCNGERVRVAWMNRAIYDEEGRVTEILCVGIDVTEKWQLEKRLAQAQKMEAIGTLAGGIAHDFNNILSAIMGYTELSLIDITQDSAIRSNLKQVLKAGGRAKELVQQILTYSRQREGEMQPLKINLIVNEALKLLRASLPSTIQIQNSIKSNLAVISDPTNIHQVIMNLCTNAGYAMQEKGGLLQVNLEDVDLDADFVKHYPDMNPGKFVRLTVSDTGHGMTPEVMERIFDPFFSTKKKGEGTGMGLSVVHGIVKSHGGAITVGSTPGQGSVFQLYFPAIESLLNPQNESVNLMVTGTERILFVDDEPFQADIAQMMLNRLGYRLTTCTNSVEALAAFRQTPQEFDLVITDMTMPRMPGDVLARELLSIRPDIPIIACTGYSERINSQIANEIGIRELVMKPLVIKDIARVIRRVLDENIERPTPFYKRR
jgi:two-component system cell cycle sensor histidine kinase/response regulator CckA